MPTKTLDNRTRIYYEETGTGRPLILVHGFGMSHSIWEKVAESLKKEFKVVALDLRGHGMSSKPASGYSIETFTDDLHNLIVQLDLKEPIYVGWSLGVAIGLRLSAKYPNEISDTVLVGGTPCWGRLPDFEFGHPIHLIDSWIDGIQEDHAHWIENFIVRMFRKKPEPPAITQLCSIAMQLPPHAAIEIIRDSTKADLRSCLPRVTQRTAIFHGRHDKMDYIEAAKYMADAIPSSKFVVFEKSGHVPFLEEKDRFLSELLSFARKGK